MVKRRRTSFARAHTLLGELRTPRPVIHDAVYATPRQLQALKSLQKLLIKEIIRAERKIRRSKSILKTLEAVAPEATAQLKERIESYRHLAYIWRCFGDAIAFLFMDKFALKQTFFNTHNCNAKQDAGFLAGKAGLSGEWMVMEEFLSKGIPALISDLTNTIRHGDVCVMIGPEPHLIEVKWVHLIAEAGVRKIRSVSSWSFSKPMRPKGCAGWERCAAWPIQTASYST